MLPIVTNILLGIHVLVSLLIILLVLMQRPKSEGLGAAFGGGMTDNLFGAQSTNVLQTITRWLGFMFFALTLGLSLLYVKAPTKSIQNRLPTAVPAPATPAVPEQKTDAAPTDATPAPPEATTPPVKPDAPAPDAPAPAPVPPAAPEKTPETPAK